MRRRIVLTLMGLLAVSSAAPASAAPRPTAPRYDVVVYGGTSAGVTAAVQAARMGRSVVLVHPGRHVGGLSSSGLGMTDTGDKSAVGGMSREFYRRVKDHYDQQRNWKHNTPDEYPHYDADAETIWRFEPHVAEAVFNDLLDEANVPVALNQKLDRSGDGVRKKNGRIVAFTTRSGRTYRGKVFIDATYEGDLLAEAGVPYTVGREPQSRYDERWAGVHKKARHHRHHFDKNISPYVEPGNPDSGLVPRVHGKDPGEEGEGDHRVQAYCFRMCMTDVEANRVPWEKPSGYDPAQYELLFRAFEAGEFGETVHMNEVMKPDMMPNRKTDTNNRGPFSTDNIGKNYEYPEASYAEREKIVEEHLRYQKGLMWTLAHHPRTPKNLRQEVQQWGLAADEFQDNNHWPYKIYVREARRMVGRYVMTEHDCRRTVETPEPVGLGSYTMDSHNTQRFVTEEGYVQNEGDIGVHPGGAYEIAYGSLVPKKRDCTNLLVPAAVSASHIAFGSIRMEPVFMVLGQSAGTAASQAVTNDVAVQDVDYAKLKKQLLEDGQRLETDAPPKTPPIRLSELDGLALDDTDAEPTGLWPESRSVAPFLGEAYRHDSNAGKGSKRMTYRIDLPETGRYTVRLSYTPHGNRASNAPVTIHHAGGTKTVRVNQRQAPPEDNAFTPLGTYRFEKGEAKIVITNKGTDGYVIADAVQLLPAE